jgi:hypothetical protein
MGSEPVLDVLVHLGGDLPGEEMGGVGVAVQGAVGQVGGGFLAGGGGDVAIARCTQHQSGHLDVGQIFQAAIALAQGAAEGLTGGAGSAPVGGQALIGQATIGRWGVALEEVTV